MQHTTLLYLIKKESEKISHICLAMKKRSFGAGRWNGVGGKLNPGESIEQALVRETIEEIDVTPEHFFKKAELVFTFPHKKEWDQIVNVYFCDEWQDEPRESEEMQPKWFGVEEIPFPQMWPSDTFWLSRLLEGEFLKGGFTLGGDDCVLEYNLEKVSAI